MRIFGKGKCKFIANFSATMVTSLPSLSLSLSHRLYLTHNIGSASYKKKTAKESSKFLYVLKKNYFTFVSFGKLELTMHMKSKRFFNLLEKNRS